LTAVGLSVHDVGLKPCLYVWFVCPDSVRYKPFVCLCAHEYDHVSASGLSTELCDMHLDAQMHKIFPGFFWGVGDKPTCMPP